MVNQEDHLKPWLWLPPQMAHDWAPWVLKGASFFYGKKRAPEWKSFQWRHLHFPNPLGISGGVDKNAQNVKDWRSLGSGFIEVGTVTPQPQGPNDPPLLLRNISNRTLWNKMGFPNRGIEFVFNQLNTLNNPFSTPLFINIGKNRNTPLQEAAKDYLRAMEYLHPFADVFVINISSPNTTDLRKLFEPTYFCDFLSPLKELSKKMINKRGQNPLIILKMSPDLNTKEIEFLLSQSLSLDIDGWIFSNTSQKLNEQEGFPPMSGGTSGKALSPRSKEILKFALDFLGQDKQDRLVVSAGGVFSFDEILLRLEMGCHLIQVYSSLIFEGPFFFQHMQKQASFHLKAPRT